MTRLTELTGLIHMGYSPEEIADKWNLPVTTVYKYMRRDYGTPMPEQWKQEWIDVTAQLRPYFHHA